MGVVGGTQAIPSYLEFNRKCREYIYKSVLRELNVESNRREKIISSQRPGYIQPRRMRHVLDYCSRTSTAPLNQGHCSLAIGLRQPERFLGEVVGRAIPGL